MITKRELLARIESQEKQIAELKRKTSILEEKFSRIEKLHCIVDDRHAYDDGGVICVDMATANSGRYGHADKATTERGGVVEFVEIARLIIDGKPIQRTKSEPIEITAACGKIKQEEEHGNN